MADVPSPWGDAVLAATLLAIDPAGLGGACLHALPGPVRDGWLVLLRGLLPEGAPWRRVPLDIADGRLLGGLDLTATLRAGRPVAERGLLAEADGGVVILAMAERLAAGTAARLGAVLDTGLVNAERDGMALRSASRIGVVALDEGIGPEESPPAALLDRLAFRLDLTALRHADAAQPPPADLDIPRAILPAVTAGADVLEALAGTALALGILSLRAPILALAAARAAAALDGRDAVTEADAALAARLVLGPRATQLPAAEPPEPEPPEPPPPEDAPPPEAETPPPPPPDAEALQDILLAAAAASMPSGLLNQLRLAQSPGRASAPGKAGQQKQSPKRGRPIGNRAGELRGGARLALVETLRAAAPWQRLRGATGGHIAIRPEDIRILRFRQKSETATLFLVDASGSSALNRLAEAKGAVELLLADCYVRRDRVALIAFRGTTAELLLPPTTSLVRAKRSLAGLPGGGGTPMAAALDQALLLADTLRRRGQTPLLVLLTDGRANVARDGKGGRPRAEAEALEAANALRAARITGLLVDTSPRPQEAGRKLAAAMGARYLPLPLADAATLSQAVKVAAR